MFFLGFVFSFVCYLPVWQGSNPVMACPVPNQASGAFQACQPTRLPGIYLRTDFPDFHQMIASKYSSHETACETLF